MKSVTPYPVLAALLLGPLLLLVGCEMQTRVVKRNAWDRLFMQSEWYDDTGSSASRSANARPIGQRFTIEVAEYSGAQAFHDADRIMRQARVEGGLANLWSAVNGGKATIYAGRFRDKDSREAKAMLKQVRRAKINEETPFEDARIVMLTSNRGEVLHPHDLRALRGRGLYTLQIGYYDPGYGPDFRKAAETAVEVLREAGEDAYYYHGPIRSLVLLNAWTYAEAFTRQGQVDRYSNTVRGVQEVHGYNVPNGRPFTDDDDPAFVATQKSFLVPIR